MGLKTQRYWKYRGISPSFILCKVWIHHISLHHLTYGGEWRDIRSIFKKEVKGMVLIKLS